MAEKLVVYRGIILRFTERGLPVESVFAHMGHGRLGINEKFVNGRAKETVPFKDLSDAHSFCKEIGSNVWIEEELNDGTRLIAHVPDGKRLPWDGSL